MQDEFLFPENILHIRSTLPFPELKLRPLRRSDYYRGFFDVLGQLTVVGNGSPQEFEQRFDDIKKLAELRTQYIIVIEDELRQRIVAIGSIFIEKKFTHHLSKCGHIEDIVVDARYRRFHLGKVIVEQLKEIAQKEGCYKVILDCAEKNIEFYRKCGFEKKEVQMACYFRELKNKL